VIALLTFSNISKIDKLSNKKNIAGYRNKIGKFKTISDPTGITDLILYNLNAMFGETVSLSTWKYLIAPSVRIIDAVVSPIFGVTSLSDLTCSCS
jgi:hypothetical protein